MFTHLHVHTEYSLLDGMSRIAQLVARAKELGMDSLAITDHGVMHGVIEFYQAAREAGIKPIIGCEMYIARGDRRSRNAGDKSQHHLVLLARNRTGYQNLVQLVTKAHLEGFYYKPRVDKELLQQYHEGLIALSACIKGEVPQLVMGGLLKEAREAAEWYRQTFGDFYLEIQRHPIAELEKVNAGLIKLSHEAGIPLVATMDVHYVMREDAAAHDLLLCIGTNTSVQDTRRMKMAGDYFYLKSPEEMAALYQDIPQALENTGRIAAMCDLKFDFNRLHLPQIELPEGKTPDELLAELCRKDLGKYYPRLTPEIEQRLDYELEVIKQTQFANYFLVVWDIITFARREKILFGVRGSAAASIVLHCLGITQLDPIENRLVFERFLNFERKEMPDIDLDFQDDRRDEVIAYVSRKYGQDHVAQIITFGTMGARAAIRDVGRALGMSYGAVDRVARLVPNALGMTLERALEENGELKEIYRSDEIVRKLVDSARRVEGLARHASTHAAGVVISREPLTNLVPLQHSTRANGDETVMTQFAMGDIARIGLLKMDFLGLANLTILGKTLEIIRQEHGIDIELPDIPLDDARTFQLLASGETTGIFQLEGSGMRRYIKDLKPTVFTDICAMVALYRPGPMEHIPTFIRAKHGLEPIRYPHPALASILEETYGVIVYQDQVLFIVQTFAGYSLGQADIFRKAMGKKIPEVMKQERLNFLEGARKKGFTRELAEEVFALIEPFAGYAFNKAHSFSYALIAYQTAYLKANYPAEYITAFLTIHAGTTEKITGAVAECHRLGIRVLPPDVNRSRADFTIERDDDGRAAIRFGLAAVKNVGTGAVAPIIAEREQHGEFSSLEDFCRRADLRSVNRRVLESLIKAGALDPLGDRATLLANVGLILSLAQREQRLRETGQSTMFDLWGETAPVPLPGLELVPDEVSSREKLAWEKELLGAYLSEHPFNAAARRIGGEVTFCGQVDADMAGQTLVIAGMVASVRHLLTKDGQTFASVLMEDLDGQLEVMVWPRVFTETKELWEEGNILLIEGKVRVKADTVQMHCDHARRYQPVPPAPPAAATAAPAAPPEERRRLVITLSQTEDEGADLERLQQVVAALEQYPGDDRVELSIANGSKVTHLRLDISAACCPELQQRLSGIVGEAGLRVEKTAG